MHTKKKATLMALLCAALPLAQAQEDPVYVTVGGVDITDSMLQALAGGGEVTAERRLQLIDQLVASSVLHQHAVSQGLADREDIKLELKLLNEAALGRAYIREFVAANPVTDAEVQEGYAAIRDAQAGRQEYRARHILVESEEQANQLVSQIDGNLETFINLAGTESIDTGSGANGGQLGWTNPDGFVPEFGQALVALSPGTFSAPVQSQFGWHIIYLDDVRDVSIPELNQEVGEQIAQNLRQRKIEAEIGRLRNEAEVVVNEEALAAIGIVRQEGQGN